MPELATSDQLGPDLIKLLGIPGAVESLSITLTHGQHVLVTTSFHVPVKVGAQMYTLFTQAEFQLVPKEKP